VRKVEEVENVIKTTIGEIEKILSTKTVVGEPIIIDGKTIIPLISVGFAFGAGSGSGKASTKGQQEGTGGGAGGGAGIRPVAIIISDQDGVRIESIRGGLASAMEKLGETIISPIMKRIGSESQTETKSQTQEKSQTERSSQ
jgi:uncharacterized spore protein YtfJ